MLAPIRPRPITARRIGHDSLQPFECSPLPAPLLFSGQRGVGYDVCLSGLPADRTAAAAKPSAFPSTGVAPNPGCAKDLTLRENPKCCAKRPVVARKHETLRES